jgi:hypothetical protein
MLGAHFFLFYLFKVPAAALGEYSTLLKHLTADTRSDLEKVWSIYLWVVNQNFNDSTHGKQTTQWPKEKGQKDKQRSTNITFKSNDRVTRTPLKLG